MLLRLCVQLQLGNVYNPNNHKYQADKGLIKCMPAGPLAAKVSTDGGQVIHATGSNPGTPTHRRSAFTPQT